MKTAEAVRIFLLGVAVALLAVLALRPSEGQAKAQMAASLDGGASNLMALTAPGPGRDQITLFLIDPAHQTIAYYTAKENTAFSLRQVRLYKYDTAIAKISDKDSFNNNGISVKEAEKQASVK